MTARIAGRGRPWAASPAVLDGGSPVVQQHPTMQLSRSLIGSGDTVGRRRSPRRPACRDMLWRAGRKVRRTGGGFKNGADNLVVQWSPGEERRTGRLPHRGRRAQLLARARGPRVQPQLTDDAGGRARPVTRHPSPRSPASLPRTAPDSTLRTPVRSQKRSAC